MAVITESGTSIIGKQSLILVPFGFTSVFLDLPDENALDWDFKGLAVLVGSRITPTQKTIHYSFGVKKLFSNGVMFRYLGGPPNGSTTMILFVNWYRAGINWIAYANDNSLPTSVARWV